MTPDQEEPLLDSIQEKQVLQQLEKDRKNKKDKVEEAQRTLEEAEKEVADARSKRPSLLEINSTNVYTPEWRDPELKEKKEAVKKAKTELAKLNVDPKRRQVEDLFKNALKYAIEWNARKVTLYGSISGLDPVDGYVSHPITWRNEKRLDPNEEGQNNWEKEKKDMLIRSIITYYFYNSESVEKILDIKELVRDEYWFRRLWEGTRAVAKKNPLNSDTKNIQNGLRLYWMKLL